MGIVEDLADALARDVLKAAAEMEDVDLYKKVSGIIGDSSTTLQDAFLTAVRVRIADERARKYLQDSLARSSDTKDDPPRA